GVSPYRRRWRLFHAIHFAEHASLSDARRHSPISEPQGRAFGPGNTLESHAVRASAENPSVESDTQLLVPYDDVADPELSIVIPALNEELTIGRFVDWCREGLREANVRGEIIIVDSSSDRTAEIALARGARGLRTLTRGLGRAYIDALPFIRGEYVL